MRTYRAFTMAEALAAVKRDLGTDAAIIHTRTFKRGGVLGIGRKTIVEVTASRAEDAPAELRARRAARQAPQPGTASPLGTNGPLRQAARNAYASNSYPVPSVPPDTAAAGAHAGNAQGAAPRRPHNLDARKLDLLAAIEQHRRTTPAPEATSAPTPAADLRSKVSQSRTIEPKPRDAGPRADQVGLERDLAGASAQPPPSPLQHEQDQVTAEVDEKDARGPVSRVARRFVLREPSKANAKVKARPGDALVNQRAVLRQADSPRPSLKSPLSEVEVKKILSAVEKSNRDAAAVQTEMHAIRTMVGRLLDKQEKGGSLSSRLLAARLPRELHEMFEQLCAQDLVEHLAQRIAERVQQAVPDDRVNDADVLRSAAIRAIAELIPTASLDLDAASTGMRPLTIALTGPTGVGKTTTLAKLAATFKLKHGKRVGLITSDTYRIAAVEQLRTYAQIIGLPLKVVLTPDEMSESCRQLRDCDVILIDTAGRAPRDRGKLSELAAFLEAADPHEVHLVLSATASERVLQQEVDSFARVRADRLLLTKFDEAATFGAVINVVRRVGKPLSFITTGQEVPDHIEPASAERIAAILLAGDLGAQPPAPEAGASKRVEHDAPSAMIAVVQSHSASKALDAIAHSASTQHVKNDRALVAEGSD